MAYTVLLKLSRFTPFAFTGKTIAGVSPHHYSVIPLWGFQFLIYNVRQHKQLAFRQGKPTAVYLDKQLLY
jgi:hypothetical protein